MRRTAAVALVVVLVASAGCAQLSGGAGGGEGATVPDEQVALADEQADADEVNQTVRITVSEETAGAEWTAIGATYPRDTFGVETAQHEALVLGVDTDGDGELDRRFNETHVSGVNTNEFSFEVTLDTGYTLEEGDVVVVGYPAVDNPDEPGEYDVDVELNGRQTDTTTVTVG